ncbi:hypothetical protein ACT3OH_17525 [Vreelandella zhanjiangensis]|uniref:hypothetical protein n=1 Tax=Vreelandella zhanjiangensis TaxID=1121960 RepID=UPI00402AA329
MLDDFVEGFSRSLGWFFGHVVGNLLFKAGYWIGWPFVKCITLGYYPSRRQRYSRRDPFQDEIWTSCIGLLVLISSAVFLFTR